MAENKKFTLLVLAAGVGSRYGGIKQIDGFGPSGETIMDYSLYDALRTGFTKIVFIVRQEIRSAVEEMFLPKLQGKAEVVFVNQELDTLVPKEFQNTLRTKPWGTSHAILCAKDVIHEPFAAINADDFYGLDAFAAMANFFKHDNSAHAMVGYTLKNVLSDHGSVSRGCGESDASGFLKSVIERTTIVHENGKIISKEKDDDLILDPETPTSMNFWGFQPDIMSFTEKCFYDFLKTDHQDLKSEFFIPKVVNELVKTGQGKVKVISGGSIWFGVTYKEDKEIVSAKIYELVKQGKYPNKLW